MIAVLLQTCEEWMFSLCFLRGVVVWRSFSVWTGLKREHTVWCTEQKTKRLVRILCMVLTEYYVISVIQCEKRFAQDVCYCDSYCHSWGLVWILEAVIWKTYLMCMFWKLWNQPSAVLPKLFCCIEAVMFRWYACMWHLACCAFLQSILLLCKFQQTS